MANYPLSRLSKLHVHEDGTVTGVANFEPPKQIVEAIRLIGEARRHMTIWEFEAFIHGNVRTLGGHGFLCSIGKAILDGATIDAGPVRTIDAGPIRE